MSDGFRIRDGGGISSPSLVFFIEKIRRNIDAAIRIAGDPSRLRPHVKTHKCRKLVEELLARGVGKFKCAVLPEARMLAEAGARDILVAYPLVGPAVGGLVGLVKEFPAVRFSVLVDHEVSAGLLSSAATSAGVTLEVFADYDPGMGRTGVSGEAFLSLYESTARLPGLRTAGIHAYDGHVVEKDFEKRCTITDAIHEEVMRTAGVLTKRGLAVPTIVMGGTPSFPCHARKAGIELSPGTFVLHDEGYRTAFPDLPFEPAAAVFSRIVSIPGANRITLDAGSKALSTDPELKGRVLGVPVLKTVRMSEEHWVLETSPEYRGKTGGEVLIIPYHVCTTVNLHPSAWVVDGEGNLIDRWAIEARGHESGMEAIGVNG